MSEHRKPKIFLALGAILAVALGNVACTAQAYCEKKRECAADPPGEDYVRICTINYDGQLRSYEVNREEECQVLATAKRRYDSCTSALDCTDFNEVDHNGQCDDERDEYLDALQDAEAECTTFD